MTKYTKAEVKFNSGRGACLCNECGYILSYGVEHTDVKRYCEDCVEEKLEALRTKLIENNP